MRLILTLKLFSEQASKASSYYHAPDNTPSFDSLRVASGVLAFHCIASCCSSLCRILSSPCVEFHIHPSSDLSVREQLPHRTSSSGLSKGSPSSPPRNLISLKFARRRPTWYIKNDVATTIVVRGHFTHDRGSCPCECICHCLNAPQHNDIGMQTCALIRGFICSSNTSSPPRFQLIFSSSWLFPHSQQFF